MIESLPAATIRIAKKLEQSVKYKPKSAFDVYPRPDHGRIEMTCTLWVPNIKKSNEIITVQAKRYLEIEMVINAALDEDRILKDFVQYLVLQTERHEMDEWLMWNGKQITETHSED